MSLSRPLRGREDEDGEGSRPPKRPRGCSGSCSCCSSRQEIEDFLKDQIEKFNEETQRTLKRSLKKQRKSSEREMQELYQNLPRQLMEQIREATEQLIREQLKTWISEITTPGDHVGENSNLRAFCHQNETYRLKFENTCCKVQWSGHEIQTDDGNPVKVTLYDHNRMIIANGPLSSMKVKIAIVEGKSIFTGRSGKPPLFANDVYLKLKNGVASLSADVKFQDNVPSRNLRLRVTKADDNISETVLEGISEYFVIKSGRGYKKAMERGSVAPVKQKKLEGVDTNLGQDLLGPCNKDKSNLPEGLLEVSKMNAYDNLTVTQHGENEVITGDNGSCYLLGSSSAQPLPTLPTKFHDDGSYQSEAWESRPAQESPRSRQYWMGMVSMVAALHAWGKRAVFWSAFSRELLAPAPPGGSYGMTDEIIVSPRFLLQ